MHKTAIRQRKNNSNYDLQDDLERIKAAILDATFDAKSRTNELLAQSWDDLKEKSMDVRENVTNFASKKPYKTAGIALLTGLLIGYFIHK
jgi:ElaB/YqjD/DUF883 family membrane-anchored ribosome-binding protein